MQENEEQPFDPRYALHVEALMAFISKRGRIGREQLLDAVFRTFDKAISELIHSGKIVVEKAPENESHLDIFVMAEPERR